MQALSLHTGAVLLLLKAHGGNHHHIIFSIACASRAKDPQQAAGRVLARMRRATPSPKVSVQGLALPGRRTPADLMGLSASLKRPGDAPGLCRPSPRKSFADAVVSASSSRASGSTTSHRHLSHLRSWHLLFALYCITFSP